MGKKKRKKGGDEGGGGSAGWLTTYTDLCTLLMTFFVLLLSMSVIDENRKREALNSLVGAFGLLPAGRTPIGTTKGTDVREPSPPMIPTRPLDLELLREITLKNNLDKDISVTKEGDKLVLQIADRVLFEPGTVRLKPEMKAYLSVLATYLKKSDHDVEIRGHTDPYEGLEPRAGPRQSWSLSAERALSVGRYLEQRGIATDRVSAHGYGAYWPIVDSLKYPHLRFKNSRVEIMLGENQTIPSTLVKPKATPVPYYRYKNFWFKLFQKKKKQLPHGANDQTESQ